MVFGVLKLKEEVPSELVPSSGGLSSSVLLHPHDPPAHVSQISPWALPAGGGDPMDGVTTQSPSAALALGDSSSQHSGRQAGSPGRTRLQKMAKMHG